LKLLVQRAARQQELLRENLLLREEYSTRYGFRGSWGACLHREVSNRFRSGGDGLHLLAAGRKRDGKRVVRAGIHHLSRAGAAVCGTELRCHSGRLVENELFGHERGAFTGRVRAGREDGLAHRGTLFWMKSASCRWRSRQSCCACWKSDDLKEWRDAIDRCGRSNRGGDESRSAENGEEKLFREDLYFEFRRSR